MEVEIENLTLSNQNNIKYMGVRIDNNTRMTCLKATKKLKTMSIIITNISGPTASNRKILVSVVLPSLFYGVPVCERTLKYKS